MVPQLGIVQRASLDRVLLVRELHDHGEGFRGWIIDGAKPNPGPLLDWIWNEALLVEEILQTTFGRTF